MWTELLGCGGCCGGPHDFSVSPNPLGTNLGFEQGWTWLGLGLEGLGPGLDSKFVCSGWHWHCRLQFWFRFKIPWFLSSGWKHVMTELLFLKFNLASPLATDANVRMSEPDESSRNYHVQFEIVLKHDSRLAISWSLGADTAAADSNSFVFTLSRWKFTY